MKYIERKHLSLGVSPSKAWGSQKNLRIKIVDQTVRKQKKVNQKRRYNIRRYKVGDQVVHSKLEKKDINQLSEFEDRWDRPDTIIQRVTTLICFRNEIENVL